MAVEGEAPGAGTDEDVVLTTLQHELDRLYARIETKTDATTNVIQFIVLVFGAALIAAAQIPEAIVALPIFWTVWLLYAVMSDFDTVKYSAYAASLERRINERLGEGALGWEQRSRVDHGDRRLAQPRARCLLSRLGPPVGPPMGEPAFAPTLIAAEMKFA